MRGESGEEPITVPGMVTCFLMEQGANSGEQKRVGKMCGCAWQVVNTCAQGDNGKGVTSGN